MKRIVSAFGAAVILGSLLLVPGCSNKQADGTAKPVEAADSALKPTATGSVPTTGDKAANPTPGGAAGAGVATPQ